MGDDVHGSLGFPNIIFAVVVGYADTMGSVMREKVAIASRC
jgi:hypothetical protein